MTDGPTDETRELILHRSKGWCELCRVQPAVDAHHRRRKGKGGSNALPWMHLADNLVMLCRYCHQAIHSMLTEARRLGFQIRVGVADQLAGEVWRIPILDQRQHRWILTRIGEKRPYTLDDWSEFIEANY